MNYLKIGSSKNDSIERRSERLKSFTLIHSFIHSFIHSWRGRSSHKAIVSSERSYPDSAVCTLSNYSILYPTGFRRYDI